MDRSMSRPIDQGPSSGGRKLWTMDESNRILNRARTMPGVLHLMVSENGGDDPPGSTNNIAG